MITEDISDIIKGTVAFGVPTTSFMGVPLQEWMYILSIAAAVLLILERLPSAYANVRAFKDKVYARIKE